MCPTNVFVLDGRVSGKFLAWSSLSRDEVSRGRGEGPPCLGSEINKTKSAYTF